jgi:hypothetical protein
MLFLLMRAYLLRERGRAREAPKEGELEKKNTHQDQEEFCLCSAVFSVPVSAGVLCQPKRWCLMVDIGPITARHQDCAWWLARVKSQNVYRFLQSSPFYAEEIHPRVK